MVLLWMLSGESYKRPLCNGQPGELGPRLHQATTAQWIHTSETGIFMSSNSSYRGLPTQN